MRTTTPELDTAVAAAHEAMRAACSAIFRAQSAAAAAGRPELADWLDRCSNDAAGLTDDIIGDPR